MVKIIYLNLRLTFQFIVFRKGGGGGKQIALELTKADGQRLYGWHLGCHQRKFFISFLFYDYFLMSMLGTLDCEQKIGEIALLHGFSLHKELMLNLQNDTELNDPYPLHPPYLFNSLTP